MAVVAPRERDLQIGYKPELKRGIRQRRNSEHLPNLDIPNDNHRNPYFQLQSPRPTAEETKEEGKVLFRQFFYDELDREHLDTPDEIRAELDQLCTPEGYANPAWAKAGQTLRRCADDFMRSRERAKVRRNAAEITEKSSDVTEDKFRDLLSTLLGSGITRERIIVLFCFCADVAILTLKRKAQSSVQLCQQFIQWSFNFITERVCSWVQAHGGWGAVFSSTMAVFGRVAIFLGVGMCCYYCYRKFIQK